MKIKNVAFKNFTSQGSGIELKFTLNDEDAKKISLESLINLKKKIGTLNFEIDGKATMTAENMITPAQQAYLHVLYKQYSEHTGDTIDDAKHNLLREYALQAQKSNIFFKSEGSYSTKEMTSQEGSVLIEYIINYLQANDVSMDRQVIKDRAFLDSTVKNKICIICGNKDVGSGKINGMLFYVCKKHQDEIITTTKDDFIKKYHLGDYFK